MNRTVQTFFAYQFVKNLSRDFTQWDAYKMGLIDENGEKIRDPENSKEKEQFGLFFNLIRKVKRLMSKVPGGRSFVGSIVAARLLLKESEQFDFTENDELVELIISEAITKNLIEYDLMESINESVELYTLEPGIYQNIEETKELYEGVHLFYVKDTTLADTKYGIPMFELNSVLKGVKHLPPDHLKRVR